MDEETPVYVLMKRGLFERPGHQGYTGIKDHAGRYTEADFHPHDAEIGITHIPWDEAPDFAPACFHDLMQQHLEKKLEAQADRIAKLEFDTVLRSEAEIHSKRAAEKADRIAKLEAALGAWRTWYEKDRSSARAVAPYEQTCEALGRGE